MLYDLEYFIKLDKPYKDQILSNILKEVGLNLSPDEFESQLKSAFEKYRYMETEKIKKLINKDIRAKEKKRAQERERKNQELIETVKSRLKKIPPSMQQLFAHASLVKELKEVKQMDFKEIRKYLESKHGISIQTPVLTTFYEAMKGE